ncbi:hypothetical protein ACQ4W6_06865 [Janthinobacterium sp. HLX7-2]
MMNLQWKAWEWAAQAGRWAPFYPIAGAWRSPAAQADGRTVFHLLGISGNAAIAGKARSRLECE